MTGKRIWVLLGLVVWILGVMLQAAPAGAEGDDAENYCTADGTPVINRWPSGTSKETHSVYCFHGNIIYADTRPIPDDGTVWSLAGPGMERPDDFGRWVHLALNGAYLVNPYLDADPYVAKSSGRTLVPLRYVSEAFGAKVDWNGDTQTVTMEWQDRQIQLTIGERSARVDGQEVVLDQPALIWKDRTVVPLRFVAETFGAEVKWYSGSSVVTIKLPGVQCPPTYCEQ